MNIDPQLIGKSTLPQTFPVREEDVLHFMEAADDPALHQQTPVLYAPPTFPVTFNLHIPGLDLDDSHMQLLHREQTFTYTRRLRIGEQITCTMTVEDIRERTLRRDHMTFVVLKTTGVDSAQQPVFTVHSTLVVRHNPQG